MIVVGGIYQERCNFPRWRQLYGSGLRAAIAVSEISPATELHGYVYRGWQQDVELTLGAFGASGCLSITDQPIAFEYLHSFEKLTEPPLDLLPHPPLRAKGDVVLQFGLLEGDACVEGRRVVYDPQSPKPRPFSVAGSVAREQLALVLNRGELYELGQVKIETDRTNGSEAAQNVMESEGASLIVVKHSLGGATLFVGDDTPVEVPAYASSTFFRIGAGDIFCAAFAHAWGELNMSPADAADYASRSVAYFVEGHRIPLPSPAALPTSQRTGRSFGTIEVTGTTRDLSSQELLLHTERWLRYLGADPSLNLFETENPSNAPSRVGATCPVLLGILGEGDPGETLWRLQAEARRRPVILYWPDGPKVGTHDGCVIVDDYSSALYLALRESEA